MKKNILFFYGTNHLQQFSKYRLEANSKFLELLDDNFYFISFVDKEKLRKILNFDKFKDVIDGSKLMSVETHKEFFEELDKIYNVYKFDKIYMTFTALDYNFKRDSEDSTLKLYNKILNDESKLNFLYTKHLYRRLCIPIHFIKKYNVVPTHLIDDMLELDYTKFYNNDNKNRKIFYGNSNRQNVLYSPILEYGCNYFDTVYKKELDFVFGFTNVMSSFNYRTTISDDFLKIITENKFEGINYLYFCKDKFKKDILNELNISYCSADIYNNVHILNSKFTFLIKSYDENELSFLRFSEGITRDCIPIIHSQCNISSLKDIIGDLYLIYKKYDIFVDSALDIPDKIKSLNYYEIIDEIKQTTFYKNRKNKEFYKDEVKRLIDNDIF